MKAFQLILVVAIVFSGWFSLYAEEIPQSSPAYSQLNLIISVSGIREMDKYLDPKIRMTKAEMAGVISEILVANSYVDLEVPEAKRKPLFFGLRKAIGETKAICDFLKPELLKYYQINVSTLNVEFDRLAAYRTTRDDEEEERQLEDKLEEQKSAALKRKKEIPGNETGKKPVQLTVESNTETYGPEEVDSLLSEIKDQESETQDMTDEVKSIQPGSIGLSNPGLSSAIERIASLQEQMDNTQETISGNTAETALKTDEIMTEETKTSAGLEIQPQPVKPLENQKIRKLPEGMIKKGDYGDFSDFLKRLEQNLDNIDKEIKEKKDDSKHYDEPGNGKPEIGKLIPKPGIDCSENETPKAGTEIEALEKRPAGFENGYTYNLGEFLNEVEKKADSIDLQLCRYRNYAPGRAPRLIDLKCAELLQNVWCVESRAALYKSHDGLDESTDSGIDFLGLNYTPWKRADLYLYGELLEFDKGYYESSDSLTLGGKIALNNHELHPFRFALGGEGRLAGNDSDERGRAYLASSYHPPRYLGLQFLHNLNYISSKGNYCLSSFGVESKIFNLPAYLMLETGDKFRSHSNFLNSGLRFYTKKFVSDLVYELDRETDKGKVGLNILYRFR
ncbi:MAG: hypothetical protein PHW04_10390 [Candidatus Wallbacteria bacterium]|nr:hypothetical protein [Candidatus Wallbacteria bacterium]